MLINFNEQQERKKHSIINTGNEDLVLLTVVVER